MRNIYQRWIHIIKWFVLRHGFTHNDGFLSNVSTENDECIRTDDTKIRIYTIQCSQVNMILNLKSALSCKIFSGALLTEKCTVTILVGLDTREHVHSDANQTTLFENSVFNEDDEFYFGEARNKKGLTSWRQT